MSNWRTPAMAAMSTRMGRAMPKPRSERWGGMGSWSSNEGGTKSSRVNSMTSRPASMIRPAAA